jgi:lysophosphatidic acid acyltransferase/lysophosphatidylinositol acyltransferase
VSRHFIRSAGTLNLIGLLSLLLLNRRLIYLINSRCGGVQWWLMQRIVEDVKKARITWSGDTIHPGKSALVICNHRSFFDFYMIHALAMRNKMQPYCRYFAKDSLKYIPFFGWEMYLMGMLFIKRNWLADQKSIARVFHRVKSFEHPIWLINYLEGTRFTPQKHAESVAFCKERELPQLKHVLFPRVKGFLATVAELRGSHVKYVYDMTAAYQHHRKGFGSAPNMVRAHIKPLFPSYRMHVHVRQFLLDELPTDDQALTEWVIQLYKDKDAYLDSVQKAWTIMSQQEWEQQSQVKHHALPSLYDAVFV